MIKVTEDELAEIAAEGLCPTVVFVEFIVTHPVSYAIGVRHGVLRCDGDVFPDELCAPHNGCALVLQRIERRIGPDQNFLPGLRCRDDLGTPREAQTASLVCGCRCPLHRVFLVRPTDQHRVLCATTKLIAAHAEDEPAHIGNRNEVLHCWDV